MKLDGLGAACLVAAVALGCSGGGKTDDGAHTVPGGTATFAGASAAIRDAALAKQRSCSKESDYSLAVARAAIDQRFASFAAAVSAGRAVFVRSEADACIAGIDATTCAQYATVHIDACARWVAGAVRNGSPCFATLECVEGWCDQAGGCPGVCAASRAHGASCTTGSWGFDSRECGPGYRCRNGGSSATCVADTVGALWQPCGTSGCEAGLYCQWWTRTCAPQVSAGELCRMAECQAGLTCDSITATCEPLAGAGESCAHAVCASGLYCSPIGAICKAKALAGQDCTEPASRVDEVRCVDGSFCLGDAIRTCTFGTAAELAECEPTPSPYTPASSICNPAAHCFDHRIGWGTCYLNTPGPMAACYE